MNFTLQEAVAAREADLRAKAQVAAERKAVSDASRREAREKADAEKKRAQVSIRYLS